MSNLKDLAIASIRTDGGTQTRAETNTATVNEYAELIQGGATFPPLKVYFDGEHYWLGDGFHRLAAYLKAGVLECLCEIIEGTRDDALLFALSANAEHGLRRTNADKRKAVTICLNHAEWVSRSDRWIAEACAVSQRFVGNVRRDVQLRTVLSSERVGRDGKSRKVPQRPPEPASVPFGPNESADTEPAAEPSKGLVSRIFDKKESKPSKAVRSTGFDDAYHETLIGPLVRVYNSRAKVLNCINCPEHQAALDLIDKLLANYEAWRKRVAA